jgi:hypothetical protein
MNFDLEQEFENERWKLLALVDARKSLSDGSESAIKTDRMILATREHIRAYETVKGYWSRKPPSRRQPRQGADQLACGEPGRTSDSRHAAFERYGR